MYTHIYHTPYKYSHLVTDRRLRLFGHIARSSPQGDHHHAVAAVIRGLPPDWKRPSGRPSHTWLRAVEADLGQQNIGLASAQRKAAIRDDTGGTLWTQQRSSRVCYKRRRRHKNMPQTLVRHRGPCFIDEPREGFSSPIQRQWSSPVGIPLPSVIHGNYDTRSDVYLPSCSARQPLGWYQITLLSDRTNSPSVL